MLSAIAVCIIFAAYAAVFALIGIKIGASRERERRRAIDANNHAKMMRDLSTKTDRDLIVDRFKQLPGVAIDSTDRNRVTFRTKQGRVAATFAFTDDGHLLGLDVPR